MNKEIKSKFYIFYIFINGYDTKNLSGKKLYIKHADGRDEGLTKLDEKGYYLSISGSTILRKIEIAKIFNALNKKKVPIEIFNSEIIKNAFKEKDYIGIVPHEIFPVMCEGYFTKYKPLEFTHVDDDKNLKVIKWEPLEKIELK